MGVIVLLSCTEWDGGRSFFGAGDACGFPIGHNWIASLSAGRVAKLLTQIVIMGT